jgi:hypothetical protein
LRRQPPSTNSTTGLVAGYGPADHFDHSDFSSAYTVTVVLPVTTPVPWGRSAPDALVELVQRVLSRVVPT